MAWVTIFELQSWLQVLIPISESRSQFFASTSPNFQVSIQISKLRCQFPSRSPHLWVAALVSESQSQFLSRCPNFQVAVPISELRYQFPSCGTNFWVSTSIFFGNPDIFRATVPIISELWSQFSPRCSPNLFWTKVEFFQAAFPNFSKPPHLFFLAEVPVFSKLQSQFFQSPFPRFSPDRFRLCLLLVSAFVSSPFPHFSSSRFRLRPFTAFYSCTYLRFACAPFRILLLHLSAFCSFPCPHFAPASFCVLILSFQSRARDSVSGFVGWLVRQMVGWTYGWSVAVSCLLLPLKWPQYILNCKFCNQLPL